MVRVGVKVMAVPVYDNRLELALVPFVRSRSWLGLALW